MKETILDNESGMPATLLDCAPDVAPPSIDQWVEGLRVGPFVLQKRLGRGGMGVVWLAEQIEPLRRLVAIKVMVWKDGGPVARAMFELERQALAQLSHRAIAQIYDAGRLPDGALFFAMEYVPGVPLHHFVRDQRPSLRQLTALMIDLCLGVQHAHQRNLIHRDIKPGNILVQQVDGALLPRLIDFGIAMSSEAASMTSGGIGTPGYMSPEQQHPGREGIDQRTDVYGLGAVFAECLCTLAGLDTPVGGFNSVHARDVLQHTLDRGREPLPSGADRRAELDLLRKQPRELRAIARKALDPDREQRYESADAMAQDLRRWLNHQPVQALPATRGYRLRCFLRRNALASSAASLVAVAVLIGLGMALLGLREARAQKAIAEAAQQAAEENRDDAERLIQFMLGDLSDRLRPIGRLDLLDAVADEAMAYVARQGAPADAGAALRQAQALRALAGVQIGREQMDQAESSLQRGMQLLEPWLPADSNGDSHRLASEIAFRLGRTAFERRDLDMAERYWTQNLAYSERFLALSGNSDEAQRAVGNALQNLAVLALQGRGDWAQALGFLDRSIAIKTGLAEKPEGRNLLELANAWAWRSSAQLELGRPGGAWSDIKEAARLLERFEDGGHENASLLIVESEIYFQAAWQAFDLDAPEISSRLSAHARSTAERVANIDPSNALGQRRVARMALLYMLVTGTSNPTDLAAVDACIEDSECLGKDSTRLELLLLRGLAARSVPLSVADLLAQSLALTDRPRIVRLAVLMAALANEQGGLTPAAIRAVGDSINAIDSVYKESLNFKLIWLDFQRLVGADDAAIAAATLSVSGMRDAARAGDLDWIDGFDPTAKL